MEGRELKIHREKPRDKRGRDWSEASTRQGTPRIGGNQQTLRERLGTESPLRLCRETMALLTP